ncbi:MAG: hypothetical protein P1P83_12480 [Bacteroidales bacterium]|nr:hypothetical protein [Bacteroidales bacterium]MDT8374719.1 hypothetical protein [Bacteroidales bacterium]
MHNEILAYYHGKSTNELTTDEIVLLIEDYLISEKEFDQQLVKEGTQKMMSSPEYGLLFTSKSNPDRSNLFTYLDAVEKRFDPSDRLMATFKQAFIMGENASPDDVKSFITNNIQNKVWSGIDRDLAYVFTDVFMHSYDYWTVTSERKLKKATLVILYDAGGALHGLIFGPVVSIIEGALLSAALSEKLPD